MEVPSPQFRNDHCSNSEGVQLHGEISYQNFRFACLLIHYFAFTVDLKHSGQYTAWTRSKKEFKGWTYIINPAFEGRHSSVDAWLLRRVTLNRSQEASHSIDIPPAVTTKTIQRTAWVTLK